MTEPDMTLGMVTDHVMLILSIWWLVTGVGLFVTGTFDRTSDPFQSIIFFSLIIAFISTIMNIISTTAISASGGNYDYSMYTERKEVIMETKVNPTSEPVSSTCPVSLWEVEMLAQIRQAYERAEQLEAKKQNQNVQ